MKNVLFAIIALGCSVTSCTIDEQPTIPNKTQGNGSVNGKVLLVQIGESDTRAINQTGTLVEVLGTTISATTDANGKYVASGLDSGTYSLRFTHEGYVSQVISGIHTNGNDSSEFIWTISDSNGSREYRTIFLFEKSPVVTVDSSEAWARQLIVVDTLRNSRDTTYMSRFALTLKADSPFLWSRQHYPVGYIGCISANSSVPSSERPQQEYANLNNGQNAEQVLKNTNWFFNLELKPGVNHVLPPLSLKEYTSARGLDISAKPQLYLHIFPVAMQRYQHIFYYRFDPPVLGETEKIMVANTPTIIPIQWQ